VSPADLSQASLRSLLFHIMDIINGARKWKIRAATETTVASYIVCKINAFLRHLRNSNIFR